MSTASALVSGQLPPITSPSAAHHRINPLHQATSARRNEKTADHDVAGPSSQAQINIEKYRSEAALYKNEAERWKKAALDAQRALYDALIRIAKLEGDVTRLQVKLASIDGFEAFVVADLERRKELAQKKETKA